MADVSARAFLPLVTDAALCRDINPISGGTLDGVLEAWVLLVEILR